MCCSFCTTNQGPEPRMAYRKAQSVMRNRAHALLVYASLLQVVSEGGKGADWLSEPLRQRRCQEP